VTKLQASVFDVFDCGVSLVIGHVKSQFHNILIFGLGKDDYSSIENASFVKKGSGAILDKADVLD